MTDTEKDMRDDRQRKAAWMNEQLADRLGQDPQPGVKQAPDARADDAFTHAAESRARKRTEAASKK